MLVDYTFFVASVILFLYGFFPVNITNTSQKVNLPTTLKDYSFNTSHLYKPAYNKLIIVVIDALRYDFINEAYTPFMWERTKENGPNSGKKGCLSKVRVETPTVTLPRIKSLVNGNVPQFSDVLLNLIRHEKLTDSLLHNFAKVNKTMLFYGDDTWLKLFPDLFLRSEGTSSFYVNDYTEVDNNVTRNVRVEMEKEDWDILILHYLGLDHIGHTSGPFSPLIKPKLQEMDNVIKYIHNKIATMNDNCLILVTGDHGMKDSGGHGGSTYSEMHVPLILLGLDCLATPISQTDIVPTLAALFGLELPSMSIGVVVANFLKQQLSKEQLLYVLRYNSLHLSAKSGAGANFDQISNQHYLLLKQEPATLTFDGSVESLVFLYEKQLQEMSDNLRNRSTSQDLNTLIISCLSAINVFLTYCKHPSKSSVAKKLNYCAIVCALLRIFLPAIATLNFSFLLVVAQMLLTLFNVFALIVAKKLELKFDSFSLLLLSLLIHPLFFAASSFVEEEHQIWYYYCTSIAILGAVFHLKLRNCLCDTMLLLVAFRFIKRINQTGDKWASWPDYKSFLQQDENVPFLIVFFTCSLFVLFLYCLYISDINRKNYFFITIIVLFICIFRVFNFNSIHVALPRIIWFLLLGNFVINMNYKTLLITWLLFSALLLRPYNVVLLPFALHASDIINKYVENARFKQILHLYLGIALYFCQGHSNSLSSIDIAAGYVGLTEYNPIIVGFQVFCHSYTFPVLAYILAKKSVNSKTPVQLNYFILHQMLSTSVVIFVVLLQRHHLFIWSVFAPKLLIEASHTVKLYIIVFIETIFCKFLKSFYYNCNKVL